MSFATDAFHAVLGHVGSFGPLSQRGTAEIVAPGASVRALGEAVHDVLLVECGLFEVATAAEPPRWATPGAMIGLAAALSGAPSAVSVTAVRHGRILRIPARALWDTGGDIASSVAAIARLAQLPDHELSTLPPDPLVIAALFDGCDDELARTITAHLEHATHTLHDARLVRIAERPAPAMALADELATLELGAKTVVYALHGAHGTRAADIVAHADYVILVQPLGAATVASAAGRVACDGSSRRHTELVYVGRDDATPTRTTRRMHAPPNVQRIHVLSDPSSARMELLLAELRERAREHEVLREFGLFAALSDAELAWVHAALRWESIDGGSLLVKQGDTADDAWLVRAGRLHVVRDTAAGERHVAWLGPGTVVGEMALLTDGPRSTSVRAVRDSTVARLDRATFITLLERSAGFAAAVARLMAARAVVGTNTEARRARTFTVVPLTDPERVRHFVVALTTSLMHEGVDATVVDAERLDANLGAGASAIRRGELGEEEIVRWLDRIEQRHDAVVLVCDAESDSWTRRALRQCDHALLVADAMTSPELRPTERATSSEGFVGQRHLVLLQPAGITEANGTGAWLAPRPLHAHHHVRDGARDDLARLARRVTGRAVALALSGAGSRAPAHFGVVRAMTDHALPIDIASGSSSGAGVAALLAMGLGPDERMACAMKIITNGAPTLRQLQPPVTALTSGAGADRALQMVFGDRQLEDQLMPAILTAVDIRRHRAVQLTRGPIWMLVRASGSLPLLWPPVWHEDALLVDGGIISNLPLDVFGDQADDGLVIASNLDPTAGRDAPVFEKSLRYGTTFSGWAELVRRLRRSKQPRPPGLLGILFHSMGIPSFQQQDGLAALAQRPNVCVLTPPLGHYGLFDVTAEDGRSLEHASWEYAHGALRASAAAWHAQRGTDAPMHATTGDV